VFVEIINHQNALWKNQLTNAAENIRQSIGGAGRALSPLMSLIIPHRETYWSRIRRWIVRDFQIFILSAVKISKQYLQTASAFEGPSPDTVGYRSFAPGSPGDEVAAGSPAGLRPPNPLGHRPITSNENSWCRHGAV